MCVFGINKWGCGCFCKFFIYLIFWTVHTFSIWFCVISFHNELQNAYHLSLWIVHANQYHLSVSQKVHAGNQRGPFKEKCHSKTQEQTTYQDNVEFNLREEWKITDSVWPWAYSPSREAMSLQLQPRCTLIVKWESQEDPFYSRGVQAEWLHGQLTGIGFETRFLCLLWGNGLRKVKEPVFLEEIEAYLGF